MSHTSTTKTELTNADTLTRACERLGIEAPQLGQHRLFDRTEHTGYAVKLAGWNYPAIVDTQTGKVHFDNYGGKWGDDQKLDQLKDAYAAEAAINALQAMGWTWTERQTETGATVLECDAASQW